jgi:hypothetical protein
LRDGIPCCLCAGALWAGGAAGASIGADDPRDGMPELTEGELGVGALCGIETDGAGAMGLGATIGAGAGVEGRGMETDGCGAGRAGIAPGMDCGLASIRICGAGAAGAGAACIGRCTVDGMPGDGAAMGERVCG